MREDSFPSACAYRKHRINENMEFASPTSISPPGAQRASRVRRRCSAALKSRTALHLENLALRHQLGVLRRSVKRPKLTSADRLLWAWLCEAWRDWGSAL